MHRKQGCTYSPIDRKVGRAVHRAVFNVDIVCVAVVCVAVFMGKACAGYTTAETVLVHVPYTTSRMSLKGRSIVASTGRLCDENIMCFDGAVFCSSELESVARVTHKNDKYDQAIKYVHRMVCSVPCVSLVTFVCLGICLNSSFVCLKHQTRP